MSGKLRIVGRSYPRREAREIVTGGAKYSADIRLPNILYAKILGSAHPHAVIKKIDVSKAKKIEGVVDFLTHEDVPKIPLYPPESRSMLMLSERVKYVGEPVVVVAAESEEKADEALECVEIEYEKLPAVFDAVEATKPSAPKLYPKGNISDAGGVPLVVEWGDIEKAIKSADVMVEGTFKTSMQSHSPIEPRACVANWDGKELTAWVSTQTPHRVKEDLGRILNLPINRISVITHFVGGGFGGKKSEEYAVMAALLSMRTRRPVKLEYTREDETIIGRRRYSSMMKIRLAGRKDGTITAMDIEAYFNLGSGGNPTGGSVYLGESALCLYKFENVKFKIYDVNTNLNTAIPFRGVHIPALQFCLEQLVDQIAERLKINPVEIRIKNSYRTNDKLKPYGITLSNYSIEECVARGVKASGFLDKWKGWGVPVKSENSKKRGIGVATSLGWGDFMKHHTSATVKIYPNATAELFVGSQDIGTGSNTTLSQIAAEELGIPLENIKIVTGDTKLTPDDWGAIGSRTLYSVGLAVKNAAENAKEKLLNVAAQKLGLKEKVLKFKDGVICLQDKVKIPISDIIKEPIVEAYHGTIEEFAAPNRFAVFRGGAMFHVAEVEVDTETGEITVLKYIAVQDVGKAINPAIVEGQIYGGILQGFGFCLKEELLIDAGGRILNPNFLDYKIYTLQDAPDTELIIVESSEPSGPFGAMGVGEYGISPVPGAVANAVYNAIGIRMNELPMTPERVLKALGKI